MENDNYKAFLNELKGLIPRNRIYTDSLRRFAWGTDAGFYRLTPRIVIRSDNEKEISEIMRAASKLSLPVTFRAAGTSLSGQAISDSILVVAGKHWEKYSVSKGGELISVQPGLTGGRINQILAPYHYKLGPDPASVESAMIGGIVINNASGMSCGTHANSDKQMISARMILPDGTLLDTGDEKSREDFRKSHPDFIAAIEALRDSVRADKELSERISYKYSIKNVTGLNLLPLVRFTDPFDIMAHLLVGSEGTLAFLSGVTLRNVPIYPFRASAMIYFDGLKEAAKAVLVMKKLGVDINAAEMLDRRSLMSMDDPALKEAEARGIKNLTAVLTEVVALDHENLQADIDSIRVALEPFKKFGEVSFTENPAEYSKYWAIRSGIFPAVGGMRKQGTTCLIEDVAFHIEDLPEATEELSALLDRHGYDDSCIYGHSLEGNYHFILNQSFDSPQEVARYEDMIRDVAKMVVEKYDGSLKAEHGTGRNMAPFVLYEWGDKAFALMQKIKKLFDPQGIMNPGVIFNDDPKCFLKNFKALPVLKPRINGANALEAGAEGLSPAIEPELLKAYKRLNKCIECGFCERNCLSCGLTLSPRTRITLQREITRLEAVGDMAMAKKLKKQYHYLGDETCAGDGLCSTSCPMGINTADLTHQIRREDLPLGSGEWKLWNKSADSFDKVEGALRGVMKLATFAQTLLGDKAMSAVGKGLHAMGAPLWTPSMPKAYKIPEGLSDKGEDERTVVYLPSCMNQMMGLPKASKEKKPLVEETVELIHKAGWKVIFPENMAGLCCGTIWESKGMPEIADRKTSEVEKALLKASENGRYPVLCDQSPCLERLRKKISSLKLYEPSEFILKYLSPSLTFHQDDVPVAIHLTCSTRLMKLSGCMIELARRCSSKVIIPEEVGCCGFAGDKGFFKPELNAWALRKLKAQVKDVPVGYSNSRTCEIGLRTNSGIPYESIVYLVNKHTEAKG